MKDPLRQERYHITREKKKEKQELVQAVSSMTEKQLRDVVSNVRIEMDRQMENGQEAQAGFPTPLSFPLSPMLKSEKLSTAMSRLWLSLRLSFWLALFQVFDVLFTIPIAIWARLGVILARRFLRLKEKRDRLE